MGESSFELNVNSNVYGDVTTTPSHTEKKNFGTVYDKKEARGVTFSCVCINRTDENREVYVDLTCHK